MEGLPVDNKFLEKHDHKEEQELEESGQESKKQSLI